MERGQILKGQEAENMIFIQQKFERERAFPPEGRMPLEEFCKIVLCKELVGDLLRVLQNYKNSNYITLLRSWTINAWGAFLSGRVTEIKDEMLDGLVCDCEGKLSDDVSADWQGEF